MASRLKVCTLQRIAPILNVGWYFETFRPTNVTLVTLVWRCITSWNIFTNLPCKMLVSWSRTDNLWWVQNHFVFVCMPVAVCACMCVVYVCHCVCAAPYGHNLADNSPSKSAFTGITACSRHFLNVWHVQQCRVLSKCAESSSAWVVAF